MQAATNASDHEAGRNSAMAAQEHAKRHAQGAYGCASGVCAGFFPADDASKSRRMTVMNASETSAGVSALACDRTNDAITCQTFITTSSRNR